MKAVRVILVFVSFSMVISLIAQNPTLITDPANGLYCEGSMGIQFGVENSLLTVNYTLQRLEGTWMDLESVAGTGTDAWFLSYYLTGQYNEYRLIDQDNNIYNSIEIEEVQMPGGGITSPGNTEGCVPLEICFPVSGTGSNHPSTIYTFDFGDGTQETYPHPLPSDICHVYNSSSCGNPGDEFICTMTISNICMLISYTVGGIVIYDSPIAAFESETDTVAVGVQLCLENVSDPGNGPDCIVNTSYTWDFGDGTPAITTNSLEQVCHTFNSPGIYEILLEAESYCGISDFLDTIYVEEPTASKEYNFENRLMILPNPCNGSFKVKYSAAYPDVINITVYNMLNKKTFTKPGIVVGSTLMEDVDLSAFPKGIYMVMISGMRNQHKQKIIIQ